MNWCGHILWASILALGLCGPAAAGTLYRCEGGPDAPTSYTSTKVPGQVCKPIHYAAQPATSRRSPVAFGYGAGANAGGMTGGGAPVATSATPVPMAEAGLAGSVAIPAPASAPAVTAVAAAPARPAGSSSGGAGSAPRVVFHTSEDGPLTAPVIPTGVQARVTRGTMYKYSHDGINTYTNIAPPGNVGAKVLFTYIETCFACGAMPGVNFGRLALNTTAYAAEIAAASRAYGVDEGLIRAIIHAESDFNPNAVSNKGAQGLMQLMPATAARFGVANAFSAADNISGGVQYLAFLSKRYNGDVSLIAAAYNAGERNVDRYGGIPPFAETTRYAARVATLAERYRAGK
ncbi:MAG: lytic transglycosylase domain-containing protein [Proteobacteria bacterium]|nr:lytic transglycosylase domain-containing protein [Pseudomonadota bacterium]